MAMVKAGRGVCPEHDRYETYRVSGGKKKFVCGLTVEVAPVKLVTTKAPAKKQPPVCLDCGQRMVWVREGRRGGRWVCLSCGGD